MAILYRIAGSLAAVSAFGSFGIILSALLISKLRENPHTLVVFLALSDFMLSLKFIGTALYPNSASLQNVYEVCMLQAGWAQFWALASVSWNAMISLNLIIKLKSPFTNSAGYEKFYHVWVWGLSLLTTAGLIVTQSFGKSGDGTCWFPEYTDPYYKLLFFAPLLAYFGVSFASLVVYLQRLKTLGNDRRVAFRMTLYVFIFIMFWTGPLVHRFIQIFYPDDVLNDDNGILVYIDVVSITSQGALNALVWLTSPTFFVQFREQILEKYFSWILTKDKRIPLMPKFLEDSLQDDEVDINRIDTWMRTNIINCILIGINSSFDSVAEVKGQLDPEAFQTVVVHDHRQVGLTGLDAGKRQVVVTSTAKSANIKVRNKKEKLLIDEEYDKTVKSGSPGFVNNSPKHFNVPERKNSGGSASGSPAISTPRQEEKTPLLGRTNSQQQQQKVRDSPQSKRAPTIDFQFFDYAPLAFQHIRAMNGISLEDYKRSLDPETCMAKISDQKFSEGRSGSFFVFSPDKKFIIKTINKDESELLISILPRLYKFLSRNPESLIIRFYGCCMMELEGIEPIRLVVMENVFCTDLKIHEKYDLKGSWVHRQVGKKHVLDRSVLGMDLDLNRRLHLSQHVRSQLNYIIERDVEFLRSVSIMDYSLLLGFHFTEREDSPYFKRAGVNINNTNINNTNVEKDPSEEEVKIEDIVKDTRREKNNNNNVEIKEEEKPLLSNNNNEDQVPTNASAHRGRKDSIIKQMQQKLAIPLRDTSKSPRPLLRSHHGGVASIDGKEIYLLGLIDVLQLYDKNKKMERCCKVYFLRKDKEGISVQPPKRYAQRFLDKITTLFDSKMPYNSDDVAIDLEDNEILINSSKSKNGSGARKERKQGTNNNNNNSDNPIIEHSDNLV